MLPGTGTPGHAVAATACPMAAGAATGDSVPGGAWRVDGAALPGRAGRGPLVGWLSRIGRSREAVEADELSTASRSAGADPIGTCVRGTRVSVCGTVRSLAERPRSSAPALEAEIYDGSGHLTLVWLGRRSIPGIEVGRMLVATGRVTCPDRQPIIYNPDYVLMPRATG